MLELLTPSPEVRNLVGQEHINVIPVKPKKLGEVLHSKN